MFEKHIKFPVILVDGAQADSQFEKNESMGLEGETYPEYVIGEAEVPYDDYSHIVDLWKPSLDSYDKARDKIFDCCLVYFQTCGTYMVPMNKEKFKKKLEAFAKQYQLSYKEKLVDMSKKLEESLQEKYPDIKINVKTIE